MPQKDSLAASRHGRVLAQSIKSAAEKSRGKDVFCQRKCAMAGGRVLAVGSSKKILPDCEQTGRACFKVYFLDFLIPFSYEEIGGGYFLIGRCYEKIEKIDEKV